MPKYPKEAEEPCKRCGGVLRKPERGAQWECEGCGAVVSDDSLRGDYSWR